MKRTLKVLSLVFAVALIVTLFSVATFAADADKVTFIDANGIETTPYDDAVPSEVKIPQGTTLSYNGYSITNEEAFGIEELIAKLYTIQIKGADTTDTEDDEYLVRYALGSYQITTKDLTAISYSGSALDQAKLLENHTTKGLVQADASLDLVWGIVSAPEALNAIDVGTYVNKATVSVSLNVNGTYVPVDATYFVDSADSSYGTFTITAATLKPVIKAFGSKSDEETSFEKTFTAKADGLTVVSVATTGGAAVTDYKVEYSVNGEDWSTDSIKFTDAGSYTVYVRITHDSGNYITFSETYSLTIKTRSIANGNTTKEDLIDKYYTKLSQDSFVYNAEERTVSIAELVLNGYDFTSWIDAEKGLVLSGDIAKTDAGSYTLKVSAVDGGNFKGSFTVEWTIERYTGENVVELDITGWTYGGYDADVNAPVVSANSGAGSVKLEWVSLKDGTVYTSEEIKTANAGEYKLIASVADSANTVGADEVVKTFTIAKSAASKTWDVTVSAASKTYNAAAQEFFAEVDGISENITVIATGLYKKITNVSETCEVPYTLEFENYETLTGTWKAEITPKKLYYYVKNLGSTTYDGTNHELTVTLADLVLCYSNGSTPSTAMTTVDTYSWAVYDKDEKTDGLIKSIDYSGSIQYINEDNVVYSYNDDGSVKSWCGQVRVETTVELVDENYELTRVAPYWYTSNYGNDGIFTLNPKEVAVSVQSMQIPYDGDEHAANPKLLLVGKLGTDDDGNYIVDATSTIIGDKFGVRAAGDVKATNVPDGKTVNEDGFIGTVAKKDATSDIRLTAVNAANEDISLSYTIAENGVVWANGIYYVNIVPAEYNLKLATQTITYGTNPVIGDGYLRVNNGVEDMTISAFANSMLAFGEYKVAVNYNYAGSNTRQPVTTYYQVANNGTDANLYGFNVTALEVSFRVPVKEVFDEDGNSLGFIKVCTAEEVAEGKVDVDFKYELFIWGDIKIGTGEVTGSVNVKKKSLVVVANDVSKTVGTDLSNYEFGWTNSALAGSEDIKNIFTVECTSDATTNYNTVGEYEIKVAVTVKDDAAVAAAKNYLVSTQNGTCTIKKGVLTVSPVDVTATFGDAAKYAESFEVVGDDGEATYKNWLIKAGVVVKLAEGVTYDATSPVGEYTLVVDLSNADYSKVADLANYDVAIKQVAANNTTVDATAAIKVEKRNVVIVVANGSYTYGGDEYNYNDVNTLVFYKADADGTIQTVTVENEDGTTTTTNIDGLVDGYEIVFTGAKFEKYDSADNGSYKVKYVTYASSIDGTYTNSENYNVVGCAGSNPIIISKTSGEVTMEMVDLTDVVFEKEVNDLRYTGEEQQLLKSVTASAVATNGATVEFRYFVDDSTTYVTKYEEVVATAQGKHTVKVIAVAENHNVYEVAEFEVEIKSADITVTFDKYSSTYNAEVNVPGTIIVTLNGKELEKTRYTVKYNCGADKNVEPVNAGTYVAVVEVQINEDDPSITSTVEVEWTIKPFVITGEYIEWNDADKHTVAYTGSTNTIRVWANVRPNGATPIPVPASWESDTIELNTTKATHVGVYNIMVESINNYDGELNTDNYKLNLLEIGTSVLTITEAKNVEFNGANVTIGDTYSLNFRVACTALDQYGKFEVRFSRAGANDIVINESTIGTVDKKNNEYVFKVTNINPAEIGNDVVATIFVNGEATARASLTYSIEDYCYDALKIYETDPSYANIFVSMLRYGAAAQKYLNNNIADSDLVTARLATEFPTLAAMDTAKSEYTENVTVITKNEDVINGSLTGFGVTLNNGVVVKFYAGVQVAGEYKLLANGETYLIDATNGAGQYVVKVPVKLYQANDALNYKLQMKDADGNWETVYDINYAVETYATQSTSYASELAKRLVDFADYLAVLY